MKKFIASVVVCGFAVAMVACGGKKVDEAKVKADSTRVADSIAATVAATVAAAEAVVKAKADSTAKADSIAAAAVAKPVKK